MDGDRVPIFPLSEHNFQDAGKDVFKALPKGCTEFAHSCPRQATGSGGRRFSFCNRCGGWVAGAPVLQTKSTPHVEGDRASNLYRCHRCGFPLDTGPAIGTEKKNVSGIGTEGTLRP